MTGKFANGEESVKLLPLRTAILDCEIVILGCLTVNRVFRNSSEPRGKGVNSGFVYEVIDLLYLDGHYFTRVALKERKRRWMELSAGGLDLFKRLFNQPAG